MDNWDKITVEQFMEIRSVYDDASIPSIDKDLHIISIITDRDLEELEFMDYSDIKEIAKGFKFLDFEPNKTIVKTIGEYKYKGFDNVILGEYIDLTYYMNDISKNLTTILAILYRKDNEIYNYNPLERIKDFEQLSINSVYGVINDFVSFKDSFQSTYENLFNPQFEEEEPEELDSEDKKAKKLEELNARWGWERLVYELCKGDLTKYGEVLELPLYLVFNMLSMKKDLGLD